MKLHDEVYMNISKSRNLVLAAYLGPLVLGLGGIATQVDAQDAAAPQQVSTAQAADSKNDELRNRVTAALHADPYFNDRHVTVSVKNGAVVLNGFVFSDWDLRDALRIAKQAAGDSQVVDNLSIKEGGRS
jgi:osmotically-inducible protein OsmY